MFLHCVVYGFEVLSVDWIDMTFCLPFRKSGLSRNFSIGKLFLRSEILFFSDIKKISNWNNEKLFTANALSTTDLCWKIKSDEDCITIAIKRILRYLFLSIPFQIFALFSC